MRTWAIAFAVASGLALPLATVVHVPAVWVVCVISLCSAASAILAIVSVLRSTRRAAGLVCGSLAIVCAAVVTGAQVVLVRTTDPEPYLAAEVLLVSMLALWSFVAVAVALAGAPRGRRAPTV